MQRPHPSRVSRRNGTALLVVLVVATLLSLAAYTFTELMVAESRASQQYGRQIQARELSSSAVEYVAAILGNPESGEAPNYFHNPAMFQEVVVAPNDIEAGIGWFSVVAPHGSGVSAGPVRYGLMNESARLNLNAIVNFDLDEIEQREILMALPGMTEQIADSILDWIDPDDEPRPYGTESDIYQSQSPPYFARDGALESIDELLLVDGVTPQLLYGEDANRNGLLDPNEDDGDLTMPPDNADGILNLGWATYLTVSSSESNLRPDGSTKLDVNQSLLTDLYDQLAEEYDEDLATFIVAYRLYGATNVEPLDQSGIDEENTTGDAETDDALQNMASAFARALTGGQEGDVTRGGLTLTEGAKVRIESLFELVGAEVEAEIDGQLQTLISPFTADTESLQFLFDEFTTISATRIHGRINVNEASEVVLAGLPGMPPDLPAAIVAARPIASNGTPMDDVIRRRTNTGWLLTEGLADVTTMRMLDRYLTTGGDVYRMQAVGRFYGPGPTSRVEAVIDATEEIPKVIFRRDLSDLGPGYRLDQLQAGQGSTISGGLGAPRLP